MSTPKHTPEPWRQGRLLNTPAAARLMPGVAAEYDNEEKLCVFANFSNEDNGRSRILVAKANNHENAARIAECVNACVGIENPDLFVKSARAYFKQDEDIRYLIHADHNESTFDEVERLKNERNKLLDWKLQAENGFRMMEEAHELLKAQHDELLRQRQEMMSALHDIVKWNDDLEDVWEDPGLRARAAIEKTVNH